MGKYNKAIAGLITALLTIFVSAYGETLGLPPDWPETMTTLLIPLVVYFVPNKQDKPDA